MANGYDGRGGEGDDGAVKVALLRCVPRQEKDSMEVENKTLGRGEEDDGEGIG